MARLGDYVNIKTGKLDANASSENGAYPFFTCSVTPLKIDTYSYDCECVLVAGNGDLNVKYYNGKFDAYQRTYIIESKDKTVLLVPYVYCFLDKYVETLRKQSIGGVIKYIKLGNLTDATIPIYDIKKQKEIVSKLDFVDSLITARREQLAKLDELVKSRFVELFGDPLDNTKGLPVELFANCCLDMHQGINTVADKVEYQPSGYPIIQSKNITKGFLDLDDVRYLKNEDYKKYREKYNPKVNDILICNIGTIGKSLVIKDKKNFLIAWNLFLIKLNLEKVNPDYIKVFVEFLNDRHYYDQFLTGGTVKFVNKKTMGNIPVLMPSIEQQTQFADFVKQTDKSKFEIQQSLGKLETLKKALMQKYFG